MTEDAPRIENAPTPGKWSALVLTVSVHLALVAFLFLGIRWQTSPPAPMEVDLYSAPVEIAQPQPKAEPPKAEPEPEPPKPEPEPPKPEPKPEPPKKEPKPEPPKPEPKPDIAVKEPEKPKEEKPPPKPEPPKKEEPPKPKPKPPAPPKPKPPPPKPAAPPQDDYMAKLLARETAAAQQNTERAAAGRASAEETDYTNRVRTKVRGNLVRPPGLQGNPEAIFMVEQLPDGQIMSIRLIRSSGIAALDTNIERAIQKSSPLPPPPSQALRSLELRFRPMEE